MKGASGITMAISVTGLVMVFGGIVITRTADAGRIDQATTAQVPKAPPKVDLLAPPDDKPIRGVSWPALSPDGRTVCFTYLGDLWTVPSSGGTATRITVHEALDTTPHWSPDGKWIAFTSMRTGNADVFIVPSEGGNARQVTSYAGDDRVTDWSPDSTKLLFYSIRDTRMASIYSMDLKTRAFKRLTNDIEPNAAAVYSPDGTHIAYTRAGQPWWRPWYKGSVASSVTIKDLSTGQVHTLLKSSAQQFWPQYGPDGKSVFVSTILGDDNTPNLWRVPTGGGAPKQITHFHTDAVRFPSIAHGGSLLTFVYSGEVYTVRPDGSEVKKLTIIAHSDDKVNNTERQVLTSDATYMEPSPDGKQIVLVIHNALWLMPIAGGDAERITDDDGSYDDIAWSPDSSHIVVISDRGDQTDMYTVDAKTHALTRLTNDVAAESETEYSPDGKYISYAKAGDHPGLYVIPTAGGDPRLVAVGNGNNTYFSGISSYNWSPDSKWIAFSRMDRYENRDVWVVPAIGGAAINVTRYPGTNFDPAFTHDGRTLLFVSERSGSPALYQLPLEDPDNLPADSDTKGPPPDRSKDVKIDFEDIEQRAKPGAPPQIGPPDSYIDTADGKHVIISARGSLYYFGLAGGPIIEIAPRGETATDLKLSPERGRVFYLGAGGVVKFSTLPPQQPQPPATVAFAAHYTFDRHLLYRQAFNEFYREYGAGFYDPKMHGVNWRALHDKYEPMLQGVGTPEEFAALLSEMVGEVNASHSEIAAKRPGGGPAAATLGIGYDFDWQGPGLKVVSVMPKGPADRPAERIMPGQYILAIDGVDVTLTESYYDSIQDKAGKPVELLVNNKPTKEGAHTVKLKPITPTEWADLQYKALVKKRRDEVTHLSEGRLAYIHIPSMTSDTFPQFERELYGDAFDKEALVLDVRDNGGGNTHEMVLADLSKKIMAYTQPRDGARETSPKQVWNKPIVLLVNQNSYSNAEIFPAGFRALHLGKIVGVQTPGYVIGTHDTVLIDGTKFRIPTYGWYTVDGKPMENVGLTPDVIVENTPEDIASGRDRQLEAAVEVALSELPSQPTDATTSLP